MEVDLKKVEALLSTERLGRPLGWFNEIWDSIDSTNDRAIELASEDAPEGLLILARQQTRGRGRLGKVWVSPEDSGVYLSVVLRPQCELSNIPLITLACGVAAAQAILLTTGVQIGLKWVNDLIWNSRKVGGILAEMPGHGKPDINSAKAPPAVVVGIGINIQLEASLLPDELQGKVAWLQAISGQTVEVSELIAAFVNAFEKQYRLVLEGKNEAVLSEWIKHSVTIGKHVRAVSGNESIEGEAIGLGPNGALRVRTANGGIVELTAGEISLRLSDGSYA